METISQRYRDMQTEQTYDHELKAYLQYKMVCTPDPVQPEHYCNKVYSLIIIKIAALGDIETSFVYDVARSADSAIRILNTMLRFSVTPCAATEILQEII